MNKMDKRRRAELFRARLAQAMTDQGVSRAALARETGADRSTLSQLLSDAQTRLPGAQLVAECARALGVSADWLLGLSERPERTGDLVAAAVRVAEAERAMIDEQVLGWHQEARGYKIRHVPATLPDILKTEAVIRWEYQSFLGRTPEQAVGAMFDRLELLRSGASDFEIALPLHEVASFAGGVGYYRGLPPGDRREQLELLAARCRELFPQLRVFLFDARRQFSAPLTVFGPILAALYVGRVHLAFRSEERVRSLSLHFDWLVRECVVDARDAADHFARAAAQISDAADDSRFPRR